MALNCTKCPESPVPVLCKVCKIGAPWGFPGLETKSKRWVVALEAIPGKLGISEDESQDFPKVSSKF